MAQAATPGASADPASTVSAGDLLPTAIAGPLAAAAPSGAAAPVGSADADADFIQSELTDVGAPPIPAHRPLLTAPTTPPAMTVDPWSLFPGTTPAALAPALRDLATASAGAVSRADGPVPAGTAPASEPFTGDSSPAAVGGVAPGQPATLPATR
jgi:hypothetical protein